MKRKIQTHALATLFSGGSPRAEAVCVRRRWRMIEVSSSAKIANGCGGGGGGGGAAAAAVIDIVTRSRRIGCRVIDRDRERGARERK